MENYNKELRKFGPKAEDHPSVGNNCAACLEKFKAGDFTTLIAIGPAFGDEEAVRAHLLGRPYNAIAVEVHWTCAAECQRFG